MPALIQENCQKPLNLTKQKRTRFSDVVSRKPTIGAVQNNKVNSPLLSDCSKEKLLERNARLASERTTAETVQIPVVVHIIHRGEPVGTGANISAAQAYSQIKVLNDDYNGRNADKTNIRDGFASIVGNAEIEFVLALEDEDGNPLSEPGITRFQGSQPEWTQATFNFSVKPATQFDPFKYLNIWSANMGAGLLGYAQFPQQPIVDGIPPAQAQDGDGVVIGYRYFGSIAEVITPQLLEGAPFNLGRTATHEVGHWLGLRHVWGDGADGAGCQVDDFVADTPNQSTPSRGCPSTLKETCNSIDLWENYMDYTDDECMNMLSEGQVERVRAVLELDQMRDSLTRSDVLVATEGLTVASFSSSTNSACPGAIVRFKDFSTVILSENPTITDLKWEFEGGTPATAFDSNVEVSYASVGAYDVTLIATSAAGIDTIKLEDYMEVVVKTASENVTLPVNEPFDNLTALPAEWTTEGIWNLYAGAGFESTKSISADNFNSPNDADFISPNFSTERIGRCENHF